MFVVTTATGSSLSCDVGSRLLAIKCYQRFHYVPRHQNFYFNFLRDLSPAGLA